MSSILFLIFDTFKIFIVVAVVILEELGSALSWKPASNPLFNLVIDRNFKLFLAVLSTD